MKSKPKEKPRSEKKLLLFMLLFAFIALFVTSLIRHEEQFQNPPVNNVCTATNTNCSAVQGSGYGKILGINVVDIGLFAFPLIIIILLWQIVMPMKLSRLLVISGGFAAGLMALYLIVVQSFVLRQFCVFCLVVDGCSLIIAGLAVAYLLRAR
jgi:uncharacterized membrane protein